MNMRVAPSESHGVEGEDDQNHGKKSVLNKVKAKAKKLKDTIVKHGHGHDHGHEQQHGDHGYDENDEEEEEEEEEDEELVKDPEVHGAPIYEAAAIRSLIPAQEMINPEVKLGESWSLQEDPDAPKAQTASPANYQAKTSDPTDAGGEEVEVTPVISSFEKLEVSDKPPMESTVEDPSSNSYTGKISSATSAISDKAVSAKKAVAAAASEKLAPVYEKAAEVKTAVVGKMQRITSSTDTTSTGPSTSVDKGVSIKGYLAEKLKPGEEDKALSEVISEVLLHKRKEEKEDMGKVRESPEVASRLGTESDSGVGSGGSPGRRIVDRLKEAAASWFGKGGETNPSQAFYSPSPSSEQGTQGDDAGEERRLQEQQS